MNKKIIVIIIILALLPWVINAQVSGTVYESSGTKKVPLFGVNIYWENTQIGTSSDENGYFELNKPANSNRLIFSFVGYTEDTLTINDHTKKIDKLMSNINILNAVDVVERKASSSYSRMETMQVQKISGAELCKAACCNLSESFESNASVDASYNDATTGAKQIKLLGLSGKYVQMMTENIPNLYGLSQPYALGYIPGPWMESIQVSKGTAAVVNGYDAITGQINVEYKKPQKTNNFYLNQFFSSAGRAETNIDGTIVISPKWSTAILAHAQHDFMEFTKLTREMDKNKDGFMDMPALTQYNFFNRWDYFGKNLTFRTGVKYIDESRKSGQSEYNFKKPSTDQEYYGILIKSKRVEAFSKIGYVFPEKEHKSLALIANVTSHFQNSFFGRKAFDANQTSVYINTLWESMFGKHDEDDHEHEHDHGTHKYNTGLSLKTEILNQSLCDSSANVNMNVRELVPGAYFQYTGSVKKFNYIIGFRGDYHIQEQRFLWTPRLNLKYNITGWMIVRASAGKGYRKANVLAENNFLLASSRKFEISPDLKLEEAWNFGSNITFYIPTKKREITLNVEYYRTQFVNQIIVDFEDAHSVKFYNLDGKSFSNTYQIEMQYPIFRGFDLTVAFRYNDVRQTFIGDNNEKELKIAPLTSKYKGVISASYKTKLEKWQFDLTAQFNGGGRIPSIEGNSAAEALDMKKDKFPMYSLLNAQITRYFKKWEIYVGCENILGYKQKYPIISAADPYGENFDSSLIWGPIHGQMIYLGIRFAITK